MFNNNFKEVECEWCNKKFKNIAAGTFANHVKWCDKNPNKKDFLDNLKVASVKKFDRKFGPKKEFSVECFNCNNKFNVVEREKLFPSKEKYFCGRSCANAQGGKGRKKMLLEKGKLTYRAIALMHIKEKKCAACGFDKIVEVHHLDENHDNNLPENLVLLCPNHHRMWHSNRYKQEVIDLMGD